MSIEFIVQHGENYKVFGAWKVYTNVEQALATFRFLSRMHAIPYLHLSTGLHPGDNLSRQPDRAYKSRPHAAQPKGKHMSKIAVVYWSGT
ncbi:MAG: DUF3793 family protein, partial [Collinsella sp.]